MRSGDGWNTGLGAGRGGARRGGAADAARRSMTSAEVVGVQRSRPGRQASRQAGLGRRHAQRALRPAFRHPAWPRMHLLQAALNDRGRGMVNVVLVVANVLRLQLCRVWFCGQRGRGQRTRAWHLGRGWGTAAAGFKRPADPPSAPSWPAISTPAPLPHASSPPRLGRSAGRTRHGPGAPHPPPCSAARCDKRARRVGGWTEGAGSQAVRKQQHKNRV